MYPYGKSFPTTGIVRKGILRDYILLDRFEKLIIMENIVRPGTVLISDPFLKDPNFQRTTVLICEHRDEGSFGLVMNRPHRLVIGEVMEHLEGNKFPIGMGGPVEPNTLHFIHRCPRLIGNGMELVPGIFWGGDFEKVVDLLSENSLTHAQIRFFIGYSGWGQGQLDDEMESKSWLLTEANTNLLFKTADDFSWKTALGQLGNEFKQLANYPIDPSLN